MDTSLEHLGPLHINTIPIRIRSFKENDKACYKIFLVITYFGAHDRVLYVHKWFHSILWPKLRLEIDSIDNSHMFMVGTHA